MAGSGSGPAGDDTFRAQADGPDVPLSVLRSWDQAEARLFPLIMARPEVYQQAVSMISQLAARLRETCPDLATLIAEHGRGGDLAISELPDVQAAGIQPDLLAAAACATRYRELAASRAAQRRLAALARAREQGLGWAVVEESGSADRAPYIPYQRVEAEVSSGRAVVVSIEPDETLSRAVHRLDEGRIDLVTGGIEVGQPVGSYLDPDEFAAALRQAKAGPPDTPPPS
jgi:hypothetical protein